LQLAALLGPGPWAAFIPCPQFPASF